jgi:Xaa-Pro aminopeptidase
MKANMVFTVEPEFIFLPKDSIRLEDNIIVQESGEPFNMMRNIPIVDEIEELMNA